MFYESSIVIGAHEAGLSNLIACRPNTIVVEITVNNNKKCFQSLSQQLSLKYFKYVFNNTELNGNSLYFNVDVKDFHQFLFQIK